MLAVHPVSVSAARRTALNVLQRVRRDEAFAGAVLAGSLASGTLGPEDTALATRLAYGVLSAEGVLDEVIDRHLTRQAEPRVRDVLRLAAFELLFSRAPAYAVVDQAVELTRGIRPQAAGLANAVVRRIADDAAAFPWGDPLTDLDALARQSAHPRWIVDLAFRSLGEQAAREMLASGLEPAPSYIRLHPFERDREATRASLAGAAPVSSPPDPDCYVLGRPARAFSGRSEPGGWFPMDAAAQLAPAAVAPLPGTAVLDVGSGRGNKTVCLQSLAMRAGGPAEITALDVHDGKARVLRERLDHSGVPGVAVRVGDARELESIFGPDAFDSVLVDAPCSGLGTLRRYPEKRWRLDPGALTQLSALQSELLGSAARVVRPGGALVYSTCSIAADENSTIVSGFLASTSGKQYHVQPLGEVIPPDWGTFRDGSGCFQSWPTSGGPDGHFVAVLRRTVQ